MHWSIQLVAEIWVCCQVLTITNTMWGKLPWWWLLEQIFITFFVCLILSDIFIFLMVCCTSMSQVTHLKLIHSPFFTVHVVLLQSVSSVQSLSHVWLCKPMDCSTSSFPVLHHLPQLAQAHIHWVGDTTQSCHPLSSPSSAFSIFQHQGLFQWVSSSHHVAKGLELQFQHQSFQWIFRTDFL